jgi:transcriptional regulator of acetoin/glycerol metabolism
MTSGAIIPAAKALGISRTTLWEKMKRHAIGASDAE